MMACPNREQLELLLAKRLAESARSELEMHVEDCEACQRALDELTDGTFFEPAPQDVQESAGDSAVSYSLLHPTKIGRYSILRRIGKGGFGQVLLAHDADLDRPVAIKVPRADRVSRSEDVDALLSEAKVLASLYQPHVVPVYDVGRTEDGQVFVVSKFIEGNDLRARIEKD